MQGAYAQYALATVQSVDDPTFLISVEEQHDPHRWRRPAAVSTEASAPGPRNSIVVALAWWAQVSLEPNLSMFTASINTTYLMLGTSTHHSWCDHFPACFCSEVCPVWPKEFSVLFTVSTLPIIRGANVTSTTHTPQDVKPRRWLSQCDCFPSW